MVKKPRKLHALATGESTERTLYVCKYDTIEHRLLTTAI